MAQTDPQKTEHTTEHWDSADDDARMQDGHAPSWNAMIKLMDEADLRGKKILDFGCNRGGFFHALYKEKPFAHGVGVDLAQQALAYARAHTNNLPFEFDAPERLAQDNNAYDMAFSHEVLYLVPDLDSHAQLMHKILKSDGVYYVVLGEYAENPLWQRWIKQIPEFSPLKPQNYTLDAICAAFTKAGFKTALQPLRCDGFIPYSPSKYFENPLELLDFMQNRMMYFRFSK